MNTKRDPMTGECFLCHAAIPKAQATRHVQTCLKSQPPAAGTPVQRFLLAVEGRYLPRYWMRVEIPGAWTLYALDSFLRDAWVECCSHMSVFKIKGQRYACEPCDPMWDIREETMESKLYEALSMGDKFEYEYDYGSTTHLTLRVVDACKAPVADQDVRVLARNRPPDFRCVKCAQPATQVVAGYGGTEPEHCYCDSCAEKSDIEEGMWLPIVNSPRVGVCAYCGP